MELASNPTAPGTRQACGDYAVRQNTADRTKDSLNRLMDESFAPIHQAWSALWAEQQRLESQITALAEARDAADSRLDQACKAVMDTLKASLGRDSSQIKQYLPEGSLDFTRRPLARQLEALAPYLPVIQAASSEVLPEGLRQRILQCAQEAQQAQAGVESARRLATEAQRRRAAQDDGWDDAYEGYHREVEYVCQGDRGLIKAWIMECRK